MRLADEVMFESRLREYEALFQSLGLLPLANRRLFDAGCANGKFLEICCTRWGANPSNCFGNDRRQDVWDQWHRTHSTSEITFIHRQTHELDIAPYSFDVVHQSMMLSSIVDDRVRAATANVLWRILRPGGILISYDFWINPVNRDTVGMRLTTLRRLFPEGRRVYKRSVTLAPPFYRSLVTVVSPLWLVCLQQLRVLNTHTLIAFEKPSE